jgi:hypothetical protein
MNAVIKESRVETIFDHNISIAELENVLGAEETYDEYIQSTSADEAYVDLFFLYELRNDHQQSKLFLNKVSDSKYRNNFLNRCTH